MKNILVLTPIYPADDLSKEFTPVVHYFTKEWVKQGHNVIVMHYVANFPSFVFFLVKFFASWIGSKVGFKIRTSKINAREYVLDGVKVCRIPLLKLLPHARYRRSEIKSAYDKTVEFCEKNGFTPDAIVAHWINPCYELLHMLKGSFSVPTAYVAHDAGHDLLTIYKKEAKKFLDETDVVGYRSIPIKNSFEKNFNCYDKPNFMCYSGIPEPYLAEQGFSRNITTISSFIFVGTLIQRKFPAEIIPALKESYGSESFKISYVGSGFEEQKIKAFAQKYDCVDSVFLLGYMSRQNVVEQLKKNDVFVMISKHETFGLVYLEAMTVGCIVIASAGEGFDGIIEDGVNGFLCPAGDSGELCKVVNKIRSLTTYELNKISQNAMATARKLTEGNVATAYLENIFDKEGVTCG